MSRNTSEGETISVDPSISTNKDQQWYRNLCRSGRSQPYLPMDQQTSFLSPQRIQLQMQLQREYQQRQELQKNCRQDWWQRKSGPSPAGGTLAFHTPSPAHKFYAGAPMMQQEMSFYQHTPRPAQPPPSTANGYFQQTAGDGVRTGVDPRIGNEREWLEEQEKRLQRERMIRAAHMIKSETEKRIKDTQQPQFTAAREQEIIQQKILQLLKEHELAEQYKSPDLNPTNIRNFRTTMQPSYSYNSPGDLQYKIAKLIEAYRRVPATKLQSAPHQKNWQDQITTYNNMLQAYNQGNLNQSYQEAKLLLQQLLQKEPNASSYINLGSELYSTPHQQQHANNYYQQQNQLRQAYLGPPGAQPLFRTPYPRQQSARPRRDPRMNQSSCSSQGGVLDITPRLNQSYQYSEQDITQEILYNAGPVTTSASTSTQVNGRLNSTPRKLPSSESFQEKNGNDTSKQEDQHQEEAPTQNKSPKRSTPKKDSKKSPGKESGETGLKVTFSSTVTKHQSEQWDHKNTTHSGRKMHVHDWKQLEQRSRHHRRGQRFRDQQQGREMDISGQQGMQEDFEERKNKPDLTTKDKTQKDETNQKTTAEERQDGKPSTDMKHKEDRDHVEQKRSIPLTKAQVRSHTVEKPSLKTINKTSAVERQQQKGTQTSVSENQAVAAVESRESTEVLASTQVNTETEERKTSKHVTICEPEISKKNDAQTTSSETSGSQSANTSMKTAVAYDGKKTDIQSKTEPVRGVQTTRVLKRDPKQQGQQLKESQPQEPQRYTRQSPRSTPPKPQAQMRRSSRSPQQLSESRRAQSGPTRENRGGSRSPRNSPSNQVESKTPESASTKPSAKKSPGGTSSSKSNSPTTTTSKEANTRNYEAKGNARSPGSSSVSSRNYSSRPPSTTSPSSDHSSRTDTSPTLYKRRRRRNWRRSRDKPYDHQEEGQPRGQHIKPWERSQSRDKQKAGTGYDPWVPGSRRRSWQWEDSKAIPVKKMKSIGHQNESFTINVQHQHPEKSADYKSGHNVPNPEQNTDVKIARPKTTDKIQTPASKLVPEKTDSGEKEQHKLNSAGLHKVGDEQLKLSYSFAPAENKPKQEDEVQHEDNQSVDDATREPEAAAETEKGATPDEGKAADGESVASNEGNGADGVGVASNEGNGADGEGVASNEGHGADGEGVAFHDEDQKEPDTKPETGMCQKEAAKDKAETRLEHVLAVLAGMKGRCVDDGEIDEDESTAGQHDSNESLSEGLQDHSSVDPTTEDTPEHQQVSERNSSEVIPVESHANESLEPKETALLLSSDPSSSIPCTHDSDDAFNETDQSGKSKASVPIDSCQLTDISADEQVAQKEIDTVSGDDSGNGSQSSDLKAKHNSKHTANDAGRLNAQNEQHTTTDYSEQRELSSESSKPEIIDDSVNAGLLPSCQETTMYATAPSKNSAKLTIPEVGNLEGNTSAGKCWEDGKGGETLSVQVPSRNSENFGDQTSNASCGEIIVGGFLIDGSHKESEACGGDYRDEDVVVCGEITSIVGSDSEKQLCDDVMSLLMGLDTNRGPPTETTENLEKEETAENGAEVEKSSVGQAMFYLEHGKQSEKNERDKQEQEFENEVCPNTCCLLRRNSQDPTSTCTNIVTGENLVDKLTEYGII